MLARRPKPHPCPQPPSNIPSRCSRRGKGMSFTGSRGYTRPNPAIEIFDSRTIDRSLRFCDGGSRSICALSSGGSWAECGNRTARVPWLRSTCCSGHRTGGNKSRRHRRTAHRTAEVDRATSLDLRPRHRDLVPGMMFSAFPPTPPKRTSPQRETNWRSNIIRTALKGWRTWGQTSRFSRTRNLSKSIPPMSRR